MRLGGSSSCIASLSNLDNMWRLPDDDRHVARLENLPGRRPFVDFKMIWNFRNEGRARGTWRKIVANLMEPLGSLLILGDGQPAIHFIRLYPEDLHCPNPFASSMGHPRQLFAFLGAPPGDRGQENGEQNPCRNLAFGRLAP